MNYKELKKLFSDHESHNPKSHLTGYITFSSFGPEQKREFTWEERTYIVSSNNKAFQPNMGGYSIFGSCLDGTDCCLRLENYMAEERGGPNGWVVEDCCIVGYLLMEYAMETISSPKMFYSLDIAQKEMLSYIADFVKIDSALLMKDYFLNSCRVTAGNYFAEKFNAYASTVKESGSWAIKPICISSPLHITVDNVPR